MKITVETITTASVLNPGGDTVTHGDGGSKATFADRQQQVWIPGVKLQLIDGISMTNIVLQPETNLIYSGRT